MDVMALDAGLSNMAFRVAAVIGSHFNRKKAETFLRLDTIAKVIAVSERSVWGAVQELEGRGYIIVQRRQHGFHQRSDGTLAKVCGGKGAANVYLPAFERSQLVATDRGSKLAARCDQTWAQWSQNPASMVATHCDPTLKTPSGSNPSRARARPDQPEWAEVLKRLEGWLGEEAMAAWVAGLELVQIDDATVTLSAASAFLRNTIDTRFGDQLLRAWRTVRPATERVAIVVRGRGVLQAAQ
jgi:hypothetical protein